ncbi:metallophosphoesterase [Anaerorhabdus sp.]|uniref:metallophosphoesterase n=1 Tax=Anaerorhabdus sp. TaxID=1872524 RepID=UPI002FC6A24A
MKELFFITSFVLLCYLIYSIVINKKIKLTKYIVSSSKIPVDFNGYRIILLTDIHNESYLNNDEFVKKVEKLKPNIILLGGDMIDSRRTNIDEAISLALKFNKDTPMYFVTGNHEYRVDENIEFIHRLQNIGIKVLRNEREYICIGDSKILLIGIDDPHFISQRGHHDEQIAVNKVLDELIDSKVYSVLLTHRPEFFEEFYQHGIDLALAGHTHGGQIRIPFIGGIIAPHQGFFPKYDAGVFVKGDTTLIISKGLGRSSFPIRINNQAEIVCIDLQCKS